MKESVLSILRHLLTFAGGYIVARGWVDEVTMVSLVGAAITVIGGVWGVVEKVNRPSV